MAAEIGMSISSRDLEELSRKLKAQGSGKAQRRYRRAIREAAPPIEAALRSAALTAGRRVTSSRGGQSRNSDGSKERRREGSLSARVAAAITTRDTPDGVRIVVEGDRVDRRYGTSLPRYLDGELPKSRRWRHQVFGNAEVWAQQAGAPWFFRTVRDRADDVEKSLTKAMDDVVRDLT